MPPLPDPIPSPRTNDPHLLGAAVWMADRRADADKPTAPPRGWLLRLLDGLRDGARREGRV